MGHVPARRLSGLNLEVVVMPVGIEAWLTQIPPITRAWLVLAVLTSLAVVRSSCVLEFSATVINPSNSNVSLSLPCNCTLASSLLSQMSRYIDCSLL
jgi:hypothetical protein